MSGDIFGHHSWGDATGIWSELTRNAAKHPCTGQLPHAIIQAKVSIVPKLRNPKVSKEIMRHIPSNAWAQMFTPACSLLYRNMSYMSCFYVIVKLCK